MFDELGQSIDRVLIETDVCDWCGQKATITDAIYVYCSKECQALFLENALQAANRIEEENEKYNLPCPYASDVKCVQYPCSAEDCDCDSCGDCEHYK